MCAQSRKTPLKSMKTGRLQEKTSVFTWKEISKLEWTREQSEFNGLVTVFVKDI